MVPLRMSWSDLADKVKGLFVQPDKKEWLEELVLNVEMHKNDNKNLPFKIVKILEKGFIVKVSGLFAFVSFKHMPWAYRINEHWQVAFPHIKGKVFFCKIFRMTKDPLSIQIDGEVEQFRKMDLVAGEKYSCLVIQKSKRGAFLDLGYHFQWNCGSSVTLLHKSHFNNQKDFEDCEPGDILQTTYHGLEDNGDLIVGDNLDILPWHMGKPQKLVGQVVEVHVKRDSENRKPRFIVQGEYIGKLLISYQFYPRKLIWKVQKALSELTDGQVISCEVVGFNEGRRDLKLKWIVDLYTDPDSLTDISIANLIDTDTIDKLKSLRNKTES